jgi:hypothetical protein
MATRRSAEEIQGLLEGYRQCGVTQAEYCRRQDIPVAMLGYYLRRERLKAQPRLARVKLTAQRSEPSGSFALVLRNGRRIESGWNFRDADLARLIRLAEAL